MTLTAITYHLIFEYETLNMSYSIKLNQTLFVLQLLDEWNFHHQKCDNNQYFTC